MWIIICQNCDPQKVIGLTDEPSDASHFTDDPTPDLHDDTRAIYSPDKAFEGLGSQDALDRGKLILEGMDPRTIIYDTVKASEIVNLGGGLHGDGDLEVLDKNKGLVGETPDGSRKRLKFNDDGTMSTEDA